MTFDKLECSFIAFPGFQVQSIKSALFKLRPELRTFWYFADLAIIFQVIGSIFASETVPLKVSNQHQLVMEQ